MRRLDPTDPRLAVPDFPHGTERGYDRGCGCADCRTVRSAICSERRRMASPDPATYGTKGWVDAGPAARHLAKLLDVGTLSEVAQASGVSRGALDNLAKRSGGTGVRMKRANAEALVATTELAVVAVKAANYLAHGIERVRAHVLRLVSVEDCTAAAVARAAGLAQSNVLSIIAGSREHLHEKTRDALLALETNDVLAAAGYISPIAARARLGALQANGWSVQRLSAMLGYADRLVIGNTWITPVLDQRLKALYEQIEDRPGGNERVAEAARELGFYPPIHYDEDMNLIVESIPGHSTDPDPQMKARTSLQIMGLTIREHTETEINKILGLEHASGAVQTARRKIGLKLEASRGFLVDALVKPGQEDLVALIAEYVRPIAVYEKTEVLDDALLDYVAQWRALGKASKELRTAAGAGEATVDVAASDLVQAA